MRTRTVRAAFLALAAFATPVLAAPLSPNAGAFSGEGVLNDHDGNKGTWRASGALKDGDFTGALEITLGGKSLGVSMKPGPAYLENGFCVLKGENGRSRFEMRGKCDSASFGPGTVKGYFDGDREFNGEFAGALRWGRLAAAPTGGAAALPTAKLTCSYQERSGGVVAGSAATYETRSSALGTLTLSADGSFKASNGAGRFVREGDMIRFTSGPWIGAKGRLAADRGGEPAVYFELDDNRRPNGTYMLDAWRTSCVRAR
jgi:hypothetical protein